MQGRPTDDDTRRRRRNVSGTHCRLSTIDGTTATATTPEWAAGGIGDWTPQNDDDDDDDLGAGDDDDADVLGESPP